MPAISWLDVVGYLASLTGLATFCMDTFGSLRIMAIASKVLFGIYGIGSISIRYSSCTRYGCRSTF